MLNKENYSSFFSQDIINYLENTPYDILRDSLYTIPELFAGMELDNPNTVSDSYDVKVYKYFISKGAISADPIENWARMTHDTAIVNALNKILKEYSPSKVLGIMGGHNILRNDKNYGKIVRMAKRLTELGYVIMTGGGPGAMEAANLGGRLAGYSDEETAEAIAFLDKPVAYSDAEWYPDAITIFQRYPSKANYRNIAVSTWLYGRELPGCFATDTARLFSNSIREDILVTQAFGGLIFMPGSAGTFREIFQDIVQNHYLTWSFPSPMIFLDKKFWTETAPLYPTFKEMLTSRNLKNLITYLVDDIDSVVDIIQDFPNIQNIFLERQQKNK